MSNKMRILVLSITILILLINGVNSSFAKSHMKIQFGSDNQGTDIIQKNATNSDDYSIDQEQPFEIIERPNGTEFVYGQPNAKITWKFNQGINASAGFLFEDLDGSNDSTLIPSEHIGFVREVSIDLNWGDFTLRESIELRKNITLYLTIHMDDVHVHISDSSIINIIPDTFAPQIPQYSVPEEVIVNSTAYFEFDVYDHNIPVLSEILLNNISVENIEDENRTMYDIDLDQSLSLNFDKIKIGVHFEELGEFNLTVIFQDTYRNNGSLTITGTTISGNTANHNNDSTDSNPSNLFQENTNTTTALNLPINTMTVIITISLMSVILSILRRNFKN